MKLSSAIPKVIKLLQIHKDVAVVFDCDGVLEYLTVEIKVQHKDIDLAVSGDKGSWTYTIMQDVGTKVPSTKAVSLFYEDVSLYLSSCLTELKSGFLDFEILKVEPY